MSLIDIFTYVRNIARTITLQSSSKQHILTLPASFSQIQQTLQFNIYLHTNSECYERFIIQLTGSDSNQNNMSTEGKDHDAMVKLLLIGNSGVGKSCLLTQFSENKFTNNFYNTIGVDYKVKYLDINNKRLKLQIWDTAGQDRFKTITSSYYRGAHGIVIVYDITDRVSFENVKVWMGEIEKYADQKVKMFLVGNKSDLEQRRKIGYDQGYQLASSLGIEFFEASAKSAKGVKQLFDGVAESVMRTGNIKLNRSSSANRIKKMLSEKKDHSKETGCCS